MRRTGPDGVQHPPNAYVFGNEIGHRVTTFKRAWVAAVLRAHGSPAQRVTKTETRPDGTVRKRFTARLTAESQAQLRAINLHFHDLRREAGSRWLDGGVPLQVIRDWLGHANISQTSTYLRTGGRTFESCWAHFFRSAGSPAPAWLTSLRLGHRSRVAAKAARSSLLAPFRSLSETTCKRSSQRGPLSLLRLAGQSSSPVPSISNRSAAGLIAD